MCPIYNTIFAKQTDIGEQIRLDINKNGLIRFYNLKGADQFITPEKQIIMCNGACLISYEIKWKADKRSCHFFW